MDIFDLAVFLLIPPEIRMKRLLLREKERYGKKLKTDAKTIKNSQDFLEWAKKYDNPTFNGRSISQHLNWMSQLSCKVIEIKGDTSVDYRKSLVKDELNTIIST